MTSPNLHILWVFRYVMVGLLLIALVVPVAVMLWYPPASSPYHDIWRYGVPTGSALIPALSLCIQWWSLRPLMQGLRKAKGRLCLRCHYSLVGHGDTGRCPECHEPFNIAEVLKHWRKLRGWEAS